MISASTVTKHETPNNWRVIPFWTLFRRHKSTGFPEEELLSVYRDYGVIPKSSRDDNHNKESEDLSGYQLVTEGALVTNKMKAWQGSIAVSRYRGIVSPAYYVYSPLSNEYDQFLHYLLRSVPYVALYQCISKGVRVNQWDLEHKALRTISVLLPDHKTQQEIADFLDKETARIDLLIDKKQQMADLIEEQIAANIHSAIYKSGRSKKYRLRNIAFVLTSNVDKIINNEEQSIRLCNYVDVYKNNFITNEMPFSLGSATSSQVKKFCILQGDVIITKDSESRDDIGVPSLVKSSDNDLVCGYHLSILRPIATMITGAFLFWHLMSKRSRDDFGNNANGVTRYGLTLSRIKDIKIHLPEIEIQRKISDHLDRKHTQATRIISNLDKSIKLLHEYRAALITAAVTGQIDVKSHGKSGTIDRHLDNIEQETQA